MPSASLIRRISITSSPSVNRSARCAASLGAGHLGGQHPRAGHVSLTRQVGRNSDNTGQVAFHLGMADERPPCTTGRSAHQSRLLQRSKHVPQGGPADTVVLGEFSLVSELGARWQDAAVDVG